MWWYTVRASGLIAWALVLGAVAWGLVLSIRPIRTPRPAWALDLHRFLGGLAFAFVGVHLAGLLFDTFVGFSVADLFVPMASHWRPGAVAFGVVGLYVVAAVEITSLLMRRLPRRLWHAVHLSSLAALVLLTVHAFTAGADASSPVVVALAVLSSTVVGALVVVRLAFLVVDRARATVRPALPSDLAPARSRAPFAPPPPRDPRVRYDPFADPLFLRRAVGVEPAGCGWEPVTAPAAEPVSLPSNAGPS